MLSNQNVFNYHLNKFFDDKVIYRKKETADTIEEIARIVFDVLKEVEIQEPRFISQLNENQGRYEGINVISPNEYEVVLYLNQMGVFNFVDDAAAPGCALLKLSDGRKRSMSLWVEFITASGYLSARKIRSRFHSLVSQACDKCLCKDLVKLIPNDASSGNTEVRLRIRDKYTVHVVPAFKCANTWPRSASNWPSVKQWPAESLINEVKYEGFHLLSKESLATKEKQQQQQHQQPMQQQQSSSEGDSWVIAFAEAEDKLLVGGTRRKVLSILKSLRDKYLDFPGQPINNYVLKTLVLFECEKHPYDHEWEDNNMGDRINGITLQLIACLQSRKCPGYFLNQVDMFRGKDPRLLDQAAKQTWRLQRELIFNSRFFEEI